ncbi:MAG: dTDP-glucose 4,6-dehydratase [Bacteroidales bacterium]|nr:dTDP-glucose 4,6-dehydratase [Bacteroidales bacterium]
MKRYLVTGGAGFIGANFVKYLLGRYGDDVEIVVLDALTYAGNLATIADDIARSNVRFVRGDIGDAALVATLMREFDPHYVVNFAAESHVDRSITGPRVFMETNILGAQNMLEQARLAWISADGVKEGRRFLQISTDEVYGALVKDVPDGRPLDVSPEMHALTDGRIKPVTYGTAMFTEQTPLCPHSPYSAAKASADMIARAYHDTYGLPVLVTRCSNNYGPYHFPEKLIPLIINNILQGRKLPVYGDGMNVRDWLYVEDHAAAIDTVLRDGRVGEVYNIGGFNEQTNLGIVRLIIDIMHRIMTDEPAYRDLLSGSVDDINYDLITFVTDRPGHDMRYAIDPTKIATELGWAPRTPFAEGIERTVRWYLDNRSWVDGVTSGDYMQYYDEMYSRR